MPVLPPIHSRPWASFRAKVGDYHVNDTGFGAMKGLSVKRIATIGLAINYIFILLFVFAMPPILWAAVAGAISGLVLAYLRMFVEERRL